jgi:hypothetical protein
VLGNASIALLVVLLLAHARELGIVNRLTAPIPRGLALALLIPFGLLIASLFGAIPFDVYALGYERQAAPWVAALAAIACWHAHRGVGTALAAGIAAHALGVGPSPNLFDSLLDPVLAAGAAWRVAFQPRMPEWTPAARPESASGGLHELHRQAA